MKIRMMMKMYDTGPGVLTAMDQLLYEEMGREAWDIEIEMLRQCGVIDDTCFELVTHVPDDDILEAFAQTHLSSLL